MNLKTVAKYIETTPYVIQVAKDGEWEHTYNINPMLVLPSTDEFKKYISEKQFKNLDIEILFKNKDNDVYILGLTYNSKLLTRTPEDFLVFVTQATKNYSNFELFIDNVNKTLVGSSYLLSDEPDLIRIGVVNYWFSVGPILLWKKGSDTFITEGELKSKLEAKPEVMKTSLNYQGMSFIFNIDQKTPGLRHWIKSPCSEYDGNQWRVSIPKVQQFLNVWGEFKIK